MRVRTMISKLDLAAVGSNLTRPFITAASGQDGRIRLLDRVANGGKRMPDHGLRCEHRDDQNRQQLPHGLTLPFDPKLTLVVIRLRHGAF
jgi:hypothetical protein